MFPIGSRNSHINYQIMLEMSYPISSEKSEIFEEIYLYRITILDTCSMAISHCSSY